MSDGVDLKQSHPSLPANLAIRINSILSRVDADLSATATSTRLVAPTKMYETNVSEVSC